MTFNEVRNMTDKELAQWLEKIWKTGYTVGKIGGKTQMFLTFMKD